MGPLLPHARSRRNRSRARAVPSHDPRTGPGPNAPGPRCAAGGAVARGRAGRLLRRRGRAGTTRRPRSGSPVAVAADRLPVDRRSVLANAESAHDVLRRPARLLRRARSSGSSPWGWDDLGVVAMEDGGFAELVRLRRRRGEAPSDGPRSTGPATAAPAPTCRRPASTSPTWSRPTASPARAGGGRPAHDVRRHRRRAQAPGQPRPADHGQPRVGRRHGRGTRAAPRR